jgi:predicted AAA+ superfamily ATPase
VDLLSPIAFREYSARPERLREILPPTRRNDSIVVIVIDEIQRVPELLNVVHSLIEERQDLSFVLTGSSARKLRRQGTNLLGGRAVHRTMHPFMATELKDQFNLSNALRYGTLPLIHSAIDPNDTLKSYAGLYVTEEVQSEALVKNIGSFSRFLEVIAFSHGSDLNLSNIARETAVGRKAVEGYLEILYDLMLAFSVSIFSARAKRELVAKEKFYYFDTGVFQSLRRRGPLDGPENIEGPALEGLVAQHLRAWIGYSKDSHSLHYWRTRSGTEVDFIVYGPNTFYAFEVKNTGNIRNEMLRPLQEFGKDYPECHRVLLYRGSECLYINGIQCIPVDEFLRDLRPNHPLVSDITMKRKNSH